MRKEYIVWVLAVVLALLTFLTQWTNIKDAMPLGVALLRGNFNWMGVVLVAVPVVATLLILLNRAKWLPVVGLIGLSPFVYFIGNMLWVSFELRQENNPFALNDPFLGFRFLSEWLWIHFSVSILFAMACFLPVPSEDDEDEAEIGIV